MGGIDRGVAGDGESEELSGERVRGVKWLSRGSIWRGWKGNHQILKSLI